MSERLPYFTYRGRRSIDYGLAITAKSVHGSAKRDLTVVSIPGRDGDLIIDNGRYNNVPVTYELQLISKMTPLSFAELAQLIRDWLMPDHGYSELWDTYDPRYYRIGAYVDAVDIEQELRDLGSMTLQFNCKPFRYTTDGQQPITLSAAGSVYNSERYASRPYIKISGSGNITLTVNGTAYEIQNVDGYVELDSEQMNAFKGAANMNTNMSSLDFPRLMPGVNTISWTGTVSQVEIVPRWCCL